MRGWVELSGENLDLGVAELASAVGVLGGSVVEELVLGSAPRWRAVELGNAGSFEELGGRIALAHRILLPRSATGRVEIERELVREASTYPRSARFDVLGGTPDGRPAVLHLAAAAYQAGGGKLDLDAPEVRFVLWGTDPGSLRLATEGPRIGRAELAQRRMPSLPFQRPVSLHPRLARAAVNLARVRVGSRVADPFVGTGALLLEAGLLGARLFGADRDPVMVRGAVENLAAFGLHAEALSVHDAEAALDVLPWDRLDAIVTDPPYGRASSTGGEAAEALLRRVLPRWAERVVPDGTIVVIGPPGPEPLSRPWQCTVSVRDRVHRSLTREFRVYRRTAGAA